MKPKRNRLNARDLLQIGASTYPLTLNIQRARSLEWIRRCPLYLVAPRLGAWLPIDHPITRFFADKRDHYPRAVVFGLSGVSLCARQSSVREDCSQKTITRSLQEYSTDPQTQECQGRVSGHYKPASNGRNDPATKICVSRHFSSKQARTNSFVWGLFERKMPLFS